MAAEYTYDQVKRLEEMPNVPPEDFSTIIGALIDGGYDNNEIDVIKRGIQFASNSTIEAFEDYWKGVILYYQGNGWGYLQKLLSPSAPGVSFKLTSPEIEQEIFCLRKALFYIEQYDAPVLIAQVLTNLGNTMDHIGRFIEAVEYWKLAMRFTPDFGMPIGNLGFGLAHYAKVLYDEGHAFIFCNKAYKLLQQGATGKGVYPEAAQAFLQTAEFLETRYAKAYLIQQVSFNKYSLGRSLQEKQYRQWCIDEILFLNPLNDILQEDVVSHDCFHLPHMTAGVKEPPVYHKIYNQLKQEYVTARFLLFEGLSSNKPHFSDRGNLQTETLDYSMHSFNIEKVKISFRLCYSLFDKIAYLLNDYLGVGIKPSMVTFRKVWYKDGNSNRGILLPILNNSQNLALRGLFWLSKDLIATGTDKESYLLPQAKVLVEIRNYIEHKSFAVHFKHQPDESDGITMHIEKGVLIEHTLRLMRIARAAIMYTSFAIHIEESKKEEKLTSPVFVTNVPDQDKI